MSAARRRWREDVNGGAASELGVWRAKGHVAAWKELLSIDESVFAVLFFHPDNHLRKFFVPDNSELGIRSWSPKNNLLRRSYGRLAKGEEGLGVQKGRFKIISRRKKRQVDLKSHLQKLPNGVRCLNLLQSQWIIFDQIKGWLTSKKNRNFMHLP